ncbi:hypothetical protein E3P91_00850 [Wallemia ichthyophaga]|nr:hypothetical protein E3P91_00850 [Wallemia ichthyophaga]
MSNHSSDDSTSEDNINDDINSHLPPHFISPHNPQSHDVVNDLEDLDDEYSSSDEEERPALVKEEHPSTSQSNQPSLFAKKPQPVAQAELSRDDQKHFASIQNSFGAKMLASMGWKAGYGLGEGGKGIAVPIEPSKARPQGAGVGSVNERTRAQKMEAKRRGEVVSDDEDDVKHRKKTQPRKENVKSWKSRQPNVKTKTKHMSYEEVLEALGDQPQIQSNVGPILDLTGAQVGVKYSQSTHSNTITQPREVTTSLASHLSSWTPTSDSTKLPELRHNISLIADESRRQLEGLAREARVLNDRHRSLLEQEKAIVKNLDSDIIRIERMKRLEDVVSQLEEISKEAAVLSTPILDLFTIPIIALLDYGSEFETYRLDEVVVGAITPTFKRLVGQWKPLSQENSQSNWIVEMRKWRKALVMNASPTDKTSMVRREDIDADFKPPVQPASQNAQLLMTPYESMIWHVWLPRLRTALINEWQPTTPLPATRLLDEWVDLLPSFVFDNIMDQLLLPKVMGAVDDWNGSSAHTLHSLLFPWLPHLHARFGGVMDIAKRKLSGVLKGWHTSQPPPPIAVWRSVLSRKEWDGLLLTHVVPKLAAHLRHDLLINPRNQHYEPLEALLQWNGILSPKVIAGVLANTFIPMLVDTLYIWLVSPAVNYEQVAAWYASWKAYFPEEVVAQNALGDGFRSSLDLINQAMGLGADASKKLIKPTLSAHSGGKKETKRKAREYKELTFYDVAREFIEEHNLLLISTRKLHRRGHMLYKISKNAAGKGGIMVYIDDDAVWVEPQAGGVDKTVLEYIPMSLESVVAKAATATH